MIDIWSQRGMLVKVEIRDQRVSVFCCLYTIVNKINRWVVWNITYGTFTIDTYEHHQVHTDQPAGCGTSSTSYPRNLFLFGPAMSALPIGWEHYQQTGCGCIHQQRRSSRGHCDCCHCCHCWCDLVAWDGNGCEILHVVSGIHTHTELDVPCERAGQQVVARHLYISYSFGVQDIVDLEFLKKYLAEGHAECWTPKPAFKAGACRRGMGVWIFDSWLRVTSTFGYLGTPSSDPHLETIQAENWNLGMKDAPTDAATRQIRTSCHLCRWLDTASH